MTTALGSRIRELRCAKGLSQSELAKRSGVGAKTLSALEVGYGGRFRSGPTLALIVALCKGLACGLQDLITGNVLLDYRDAYRAGADRTEAHPRRSFCDCESHVCSEYVSRPGALCAPCQSGACGATPLVRGAA